MILISFNLPLEKLKSISATASMPLSFIMPKAGKLNSVSFKLLDVFIFFLLF